MVADLHRRGVRVLFPMMLWDQGTRDPGQAESKLLAEELAEVGADGINGDTMQEAGPGGNLLTVRDEPLLPEPED